MEREIKITPPEGYTAIIENGKIVVKKEESEDEKIRKELLESFKYQQRESRTDKEWLNGIKLSEVVAWLEKQGEQKPTELDEDYDGKISELKTFIAKCNGFNKKNREIAFSMIDSLNTRSKWKPSEAQLIALDEVYKTHGANSVCRRIIFNLLEQLKKL